MSERSRRWVKVILIGLIIFTIAAASWSWIGKGIGPEDIEAMYKPQIERLEALAANPTVFPTPFPEEESRALLSAPGILEANTSTSPNSWRGWGGRGIEWKGQTAYFVSKPSPGRPVVNLIRIDLRDGSRLYAIEYLRKVTADDGSEREIVLLLDRDVVEARRKAGRRDPAPGGSR